MKKLLSVKIKIFLALTVYLLAAFYERPVFAGNSIPIIEFNRLSDRDISPDGKSAFAMGGGLEKWKHAESTHFIFHFQNETQAQTVYEGAETYYQWIKNLFEIKNDPWKRKVHVFVFEDANVWFEFSKRSNMHGLAHGFTTGWELFMYRDPAWIYPRKLIAHELTHVIVFRFLEGRISLAINEGLAEYISYKAIGLYTDGNQYALRSLEKLPKSSTFALNDLLSMNAYPKKVTEFYKQSEAFVRMLIDRYGRKKFYEFLVLHAKAVDAIKALETVYKNSFSALEKEFLDNYVI